jgi:hypothetical protein
MRKPDMDIGPGYMHRWYVIPRNRFFNIYLHKIIRDDDDRALHDHPWWSVSILLKGRLMELMETTLRFPKRFIPVVRSAELAHRLVVLNGPVWTLFITGPRIREWGFYCQKGWVHWQDFTKPGDTGKVGKGCGD